VAILSKASSTADSIADSVPSIAPQRTDSAAWDSDSFWSPDSLESAFGAIAARVGDDVGVAALHLETGRQASWNAERRLAMASVYKIPIAFEVLGQIDEGTFSLSDSITLHPRDFVGGAGPLAAAARGRPATLTIEQLLAYMATDSDNTASDALLRLVGGPSMVEARMRDLGIEAIDVSRYESELFEELRRGTEGPDPSDLRNTATAAALVELLALLHQGQALSAENRRLLLYLLAATRLGTERIKGLLPADTAVAHKTGTFGPVINDVGIVTLPDGTHFAIAVLVHAPGTSIAARERTIAEIARAAYDAFSRPEVADSSEP
jgi:beta-lactamase class A